MICEFCGTQHDDGRGSIESLSDCRDALKSQLASMTKRAEDAERELESSETTRLVQAQAAEAKLATAVEGLVKICYRGDVEGGEPNDYNEACDWWHECDDAAHAALHALGIDPSKERGK